MKKQKGFTSVESIVALVFVFGFVAWVWNAAKFASCDFESNFKCEIIHGIGIFVPPASVITVWFSGD